ncbi:MAG: hypothetical protein AB7W59_05300 [Acidimicrobiia bacterium]
MARPGIWITAEEVAMLPVEGPAWDQVARWALGPWERPNLADQDSNHDLEVLAGALYAVRMHDEAVRRRVIDGLAGVAGTEREGRVLALARNIVGYVVAAELVGYRDAEFLSWLDAVRFAQLDGRSLVSTHERRPNNWGTHAGAARVAIARFLDDDEDLQRAALVFKGYLGDRRSYAGFVFDADLSWHPDRLAPVPINPAGATIDGHSVDGVITDDARRVGGFRWPFPAEESGANYMWEAMQGIVLQAALLHRAGYDAWQWEDRAVLRAAVWLVHEASMPPDGDDQWQAWLINDAYGADLPLTSPARSGKSIGFTDWTHGAAPSVEEVVQTGVSEERRQR